MAHRIDGCSRIYRGRWIFRPCAVLGVLKLSDSIQWPAGDRDGVMRTPDGIYVVPLVWVGRVQLYDQQWRFLRGWHVDANAGFFKVECPPGGTIEVFAARGLHHIPSPKAAD